MKKQKKTKTEKSNTNLQINFYITKENSNFVFEMKLKLQHIKGEERLRQVITECYSTDIDLIKKYHILAPSTLEKCVEHTVNYLLHTEKEFELDLYEINNNGVLVGYFGRERVKKRENLCGFFLIDRSPEAKKEFMRFLKMKFKDKINCYIYNKNTRGISFLKKNGFKFKDGRENFSCFVL